MTSWYVIFVLCSQSICENFTIRYDKPKTTQRECRQAAMKSLSKLQHDKPGYTIDWLCLPSERERIAIEHREQ